jgi:hypothetical protein
MSYEATVFKVMIASPGDVQPERAIIREMLAEWNVVNSDRRRIVLLGVGWDTHCSPEMGDRPQAIINKQVLLDCDLLVGVFWTRIGTPTGNYASGTVEEIEEHLRLGKPAMLYFSAAPVVPESLDRGQYEALLKFKESCKSRGILEAYSSLTDFKSKFYRQLQIKLNKDPYFLNGQPVSSVMAEPRQTYVPALSREAKALLVACAADSAGAVLRVTDFGGTTIQSGGRNFAEENNPRSVATWEGALEELESNGLVSPVGPEREIFRITRKGYELADIEDVRAQNEQLQEELATTKDEIREFRCPHCSAPLTSRAEVDLDEHTSDSVESFACGYSTLGGFVESPCPSDPKFPKLEDFELRCTCKANPLTPKDRWWTCSAVGNTPMAKKVHVGSAVGRTEAEAKQKVIEQYERISKRWAG